jgi:hypothetical protein
MLITKEDLIYTNDAYWNIVRAAEELLKRDNAKKKGISVDEIHVDPEEDYVFVSWRFFEERQNNDGTAWNSWCETSTSYKINKFLTKINNLEETK